jgi:hypothetical protein
LAIIYNVNGIGVSGNFPGMDRVGCSFYKSFTLDGDPPYVAGHIDSCCIDIPGF